jgi:hypothetical protein
MNARDYADALDALDRLHDQAWNTSVNGSQVNRDREKVRAALAARPSTPTIEQLRDSIRAVVDGYADEDGDIAGEDGWRLIRDLRIALDGEVAR